MLSVKAILNTVSAETMAEQMLRSVIPSVWSMEQGPDDEIYNLIWSALHARFINVDRTMPIPMPCQAVTYLCVTTGLRDGIAVIA